ncbi:hypothetical protein [Sphingomonas sp. M1-B02]|uniref:hypothetical protein n=1 Tax=Sphingomonas sp. M1-B02 TaxID=3114300 RepID=UPI0022403A98|nr:hypothetical protein [Sphingomonas sp. S6-11]UZK65962.1 hypothetical protein OKW87_15860 [Sphingomonas sp. S6-11]
MSAFDFLFAVFSLLLGLAMAEILSGFARVMKIHARHRAGLGKDVRVGWLVPLMGLFVLLSQLTFWTTAFSMRDQLPFNYVVLLCVTAIVGGYYLLSSLVWPDDPLSWPDFDAYYDQHNRFILVGNLALTLAAAVASGFYARPAPPVEETPVVIVAVIAVYLGLLLNLILIFVKRRWLNVTLLTLLVGMQIFGPAALLYSGFKAAQ